MDGCLRVDGVVYFLRLCWRGEIPDQVRYDGYKESGMAILISRI